MKLHILSDLHNEFARQDTPDIEKVAADVIVLAGDIDTGVRGVSWAVAQSKRLRRPVIYVPGNHEYYGHSYPHSRHKMRRAARHTAVAVLDQDELMLDGVRFLGATLWTDFCLLGAEQRSAAMLLCAELMNDYRRIRVSPQFRKLRPLDTAAMHRQARCWLERKLSEPAKMPTVVVTHTGPSVRSQPPHYPLTLLAAAYLSDLECMMGRERVTLWVHGHTHHCIDYTIAGTRVVSNQRGYLGVEPVKGFDSSFTVEI